MNSVSQRSTASQPAHVIVCGSGLSGLVAAVSALEAGARVTLLEKAPAVGGSTALSGGVLWTFADYDRLRRDIPYGHPMLQWLVHDGIDAGSRWLFDLGVKGSGEERFLHVGRGWRIEPVQALEVLLARFQKLGGELRLGCAMEALQSDCSGIRGVRCVAAGQTEEIEATSVILATGGFQGNTELVTRYILRDPTHLTLRASPWSTGDGLIAATAIGAACSAGLDKFYGHALCVTPEDKPVGDFRSLSQFYGPFGVALNLSGRRFADESNGAAEELLNHQLSQQAHGRGFYIIDEALLASRPLEGLEFVTSVVLARAREAGAQVERAESIEELADALARQGVPRAAVIASLRSFNAAMESNDADAPDPPRRGNRRALVPPLYAVPVKASITFSMGGLAIDERTRVLRRAGSSAVGVAVPPERAEALPSAAPIELDNYRETVVAGLYAVGCDVGNVHHGAYMGGLATGLVTGRIAGTQAAGAGASVAKRSIFVPLRELK